MRRRDVSPEELARIIRLRQGDTSWLQIQRDTGVSRRIAKRAYEEWGRSQAREELKTARKEVAAEEFRIHLNLMTEFEEDIIRTVCIQSMADDKRKAKDVLDVVWQRDRLHEVDFIPAIDPTEKGRRRVRHQNQMLFESLQAHTYGEVRWQALDEWEQAWDMNREALIKLGEEANELPNILGPRLTDRIVEGSRTKDPLKLMIEGVLHVVWKDGILAKPDQGFPVVEALQRGEFTDVTFGKRRLNLGLTFTKADLAEEVAKAGKRSAANLCKGETALAIAEQVNVMEERIKELEEMLDPLRLRPLILSTQCKLCPA
ncbi:hypothetical protein ES703_67618 [subsurface metagenome]